MKNYFSFVLPLSLFSVLCFNGCSESDKREQETEYICLNGLRAATEEQRTNHSSLVRSGSSLYFYSETLPLASFADACITIVPLSENKFELIYHEFDDEGYYSYPSNYIFLPGTSILTNKALPMPDCNENGYNFSIGYYLPSDGTHDFYLQIENPWENIHFQSPAYRYTKQTNEDGMYFSTLVPIE